ncbi:MAG: hypothetical protein HQL33_13295 [Alphaproteobacteria bacterium]|nr:hypothetical protein [Alphaproteobacteria bacterium]
MTALALSGCVVAEPLPVCDMAAINQQRMVAAAPSATPEGISPLKEMPLNSVSITDSAIINKVYVRSISARRTPAGTVEVWSQVQNCTDFPLHAEARTQFYDGSQYPSEPVSAWKRIYLDPRTSNTYREFSTGTKSVNFYMVEMREGR